MLHVDCVDAIVAGRGLRCVVFERRGRRRREYVDAVRLRWRGGRWRRYGRLERPEQDVRTGPPPIKIIHVGIAPVQSGDVDLPPIRMASREHAHGGILPGTDAARDAASRTHGRGGVRNVERIVDDDLFDHGVRGGRYGRVAATRVCSSFDAGDIFGGGRPFDDVEVSWCQFV